MLGYAPVGFVLFPSKRLAYLVSRVGNVRFHVHRSTNVRFRVDGFVFDFVKSDFPL